MKRLLFAGLGLCLLAATACETSTADAPKADGPNPVVVMETSKGTIKIELFADKAPITVKNFLSYVDEKFYDGTTFHRVMPDFMIQGGGFKPGLTRPSRRRTRSAGKEDARSHQERSGQRPAQRARHARHGPNRRRRQRHGPVLH